MPSPQRFPKILEPIGQVLTREAQRLGLDIGHTCLKETLERISAGEVEAFKALPAGMREAVSASLADAVETHYARRGIDVSAAVEAFRGGEYVQGAESLVRAATDGYRAALEAPDFFARDPARVAKDLCGSFFAHVASLNGMWAGLVTYTAGYESHSTKDEAVATAAPGTIGLWPSQGQKIVIISAHSARKTGTVAVWGMSRTVTEELNMGAIGNLFANYESLVIGDSAPIILRPRNVSTPLLGELYVATQNTNLRGAKEAYKLIKS